MVTLIPAWILIKYIIKCGVDYLSIPTLPWRNRSSLEKVKQFYNLLSFQMLTLLQKYQYRQCQYSKTWDSKCLAVIAQVVRAFGMNPNVGGSSLSQVETFSVSKTFTRTSVRESKMNAVARAQLTFQMLTLLKKYLYHQSQYSWTWDSK